MFRKIQGALGEVTIPSIGLSIAKMSSWTLNRREDATPGTSGEWDFHAYFSYINNDAWNSDGWDKEIRVTIGNQKTGSTYRVIQAEDGRTVLEGNTLIIEGASINVV